MQEGGTLTDHHLLSLLDKFFLIFHSVFTLFNITAWIWKRTRPLHLLTITLTALSWFVLGIWYGWGYCFCTDWHWQVREAMGRPIESWSYIHFLIVELTGFKPDPALVDTVVLSVFAAVCILSITLNMRDWIKK